jgi:hypothetical protein
MNKLFIYNALPPKPDEMVDDKNYKIEPHITIDTVHDYETDDTTLLDILKLANHFEVYFDGISHDYLPRSFFV